LCGGRIGVSKIVAEDHLTLDDRAERGSYVGCLAAALCTSLGSKPPASRT
jgi:arsenite methyltransferase